MAIGPSGIGPTFLWTILFPSCARPIITSVGLSYFFRFHFLCFFPPDFEQILQVNCDELMIKTKQ